MAAVLQLNFTLTVPADEYREAVTPLAGDFAAVPGLVWKVWLLDEEAGQAGGIYLFDGPESRRQFLEGELAGKVQAAPFLRNLEARSFEVMPALTAATRGPVGSATTV